MKHYLDFLEKFSPEKHFYTRTKCSHRQVVWEIYWSRKLNASGLWGLKRLEASEWQFMTPEQLCKTIDIRQLNKTVIELELISSIKSIILYSKQMEKEVKKLLGDNIIEESEREFEAFAALLIDIVAKHVDAKPKRPERRRVRLGDRLFKKSPSNSPVRIVSSSETLSPLRKKSHPRPTLVLV